jgi:hypothetical protein
LNVIHWYRISLALTTVAVWLHAYGATVPAACGISASKMVSRETDNDASAAYSDRFAATANALMATARLTGRKVAGTTESIESVPAGKTLKI